VSQHRVDLARIGGEIGLGDAVILVLPANIGQQALEVTSELVDRTAEGAVEAILLLDAVEGLLTLQRV